MGLSTFIGRGRGAKSGKGEDAEPVMKCGSCGEKMAEGDESCAKCGAKAGKVDTVECPSCDAENPAGAKECENCGDPIPAKSDDETEDGAEGVDLLDDALAEAAEETEGEAGETPEEEAAESPEEQAAEEEEGTEDLSNIPATEGGSAAVETAAALEAVGAALGDAADAARSGDADALDAALESVVEEFEELRGVADEEASALDSAKPDFDADKDQLKAKKKKGSSLSDFVKAIG